MSRPADCSVTIAYSYDEQGRLQYRTGVGYGTIGYHYDSAARSESHVWPVAPGEGSEGPKTTEVRYSYNLAGGLAALNVDGAAGALANYGYNDAGQVQLITLENGTSVLMSYDATYGRLSSLVNRDKTYQTMTSFAYTYNNDGYVTRVERENGDVIDYQYDGVGRLMDEWRKTSGAALVHRNRFQYDAVGNRTQWWAPRMRFDR